MSYFTTKNVIKLMLSSALVLAYLPHAAMAQSSSVQGQKSLSQLREELTVLETDLAYQRNIVNNRGAVCTIAYSEEMEQVGPRCVDINDWVDHIISQTFQSKSPTQEELRAVFKAGFEYSYQFKQLIKKDLIPHLRMEIAEKKWEIKNVLSQENQHQSGGSGYDNQSDNNSGDDEERIFLFPQGSGLEYDTTTNNTENGVGQDINSDNTDEFDPTPQGYDNDSGGYGNNEGGSSYQNYSSASSQTDATCPGFNPGTDKNLIIDTNGNPNDLTYVSCTYFLDGKLAQQSPFVNGKHDGVGLIYNGNRKWGRYLASRSISREGQNVFDQTFGLNKETGETYKAHERVYADGVLTNKTDWYDNGQKKKYIEYKTDGRTPAFKQYWRENGQEY